MRILSVIPSMDPKTGGPAEAVRNISEILTGLGHQSDVVSCDDPHAPFLNLLYTVKGFGSKGPTFKFSPNLNSWLRENVKNYDAILVHGLWQFPGLAVWIFARRANVPYWVFTHGMLDPYFNRLSRLKMIKKYLYWPWQYRILRDAKSLLFTAEDEKLLARKSFMPYKVNENVVCYGALTPPEHPDRQRQKFAEAFPQLSGQRFILFLSRLHPKKGCDRLIRGFSKVAEKNPELQLVLAGPDREGYQQVLEEIVNEVGMKDRVHFVGMIKDDVKWGAFRCAEAFALTSHQENFGIAVAESLACGLPVLITRPINIWREIIDDGAGLVADDDQDSVDDLLQRWVDMSPESRAEMGNRAKECFANRFRIEQTVDALLQVIKAR